MEINSNSLENLKDKPREGWEKYFQEMHKNGHDNLLIDDVFEDENFEFLFEEI